MLNKEKKVQPTSKRGNESKPIVISRFIVGNKIPLKNNSYLYIMALVDNYYMARYKGCVPFVCRLDMLKQIVDKNGL